MSEQQPDINARERLVDIQADDVLGRLDPRLIGALLDTLIPPRDGVVAGGDAHMVAAVVADARAAVMGETLAEIVDLLPAGFAVADSGEREAQLVAIERNRPDVVAGVVNLAYTAYYSNAAVLAHLEGESGYRAVPPQPLGHVLAPFPAESLFRRGQPSAPPIWRRTE